MLLRTRFWVLSVGFGVFGVGCQPDPNAPPIYRDSTEYQTALNRVQVLTKGPFEAMHEGHPISEKEKVGLREANKLIDGMILYNANAYAPYILRGLTKRTLGDTDGAMAAYKQGLAFAPIAPSPDDLAAIGRIYDEMGTLYFEQQDYLSAEENADQAAKLVPDDPSILTNTASVKIQLKKTTEAKSLLDAALERGPTYQRALDLLKLLKLASGR